MYHRQPTLDARTTAESDAVACIVSEADTSSCKVLTVLFQYRSHDDCNIVNAGRRTGSKAFSLHR